jgi:predicted ester cyclase
VLGISHFRLEDGRIAEEWTLFDEIAILCQSYATS